MPLFRYPYHLITADKSPPTCHGTEITSYIPWSRYQHPKQRTKQTHTQKIINITIVVSNNYIHMTGVFNLSFGPLHFSVYVIDLFNKMFKCHTSSRSRSMTCEPLFHTIVFVTLNLNIKSRCTCCVILISGKQNHQILSHGLDLLHV